MEGMRKSNALPAGQGTDAPHITVRFEVRFDHFGAARSRETVYIQEGGQQQPGHPSVAEPVTVIDEIVLEPSCEVLEG
jgi:hypothetical protein